ncbi:MAG: hypothetical protein JXA96_13190 [Sedimentisphaerales bacterium]|nr:hypothetical protein [Sedimentisphaerales bacterium]
MIRTSIKNKLIVHQLNYVVEKTVQNDLLKEIIEYCIPERTLEHIWIMGSINGEIHAKMELSISYDSGAAAFNIKGNIKDQMFTSDPNNDWLNNKTDEEKANCPVWAQAIDWFSELCKQENLPIKWCVKFCERSEEMFGKFGLCPLTDKDRTSESNASDLPNSVISNLNMHLSFSSEKFGALN